MMKKIILITVSISLFTLANAQDRDYAQKMIDTLCSNYFAGRGYIDYGHKKAANFIADQFKRIGLEEASPNYLQDFPMNINTIRECQIFVDGKMLVPGVDYVVSPSSPSFFNTKKLCFFSEGDIKKGNFPRKMIKALSRGDAPVLAVYDHQNEKIQSSLARYSQLKRGFKAALPQVIIHEVEGLSWHLSDRQSKDLEINIRKGILSAQSKTIEIQITTELKKNHISQNVIGFDRGTEFPDSFIVLCGHYDHLGKMGTAIYPGANDNASGIALLLDLARYFKAMPQKYSIAFIAFGAEEAGLIGSYYYSKNPLKIMPLEKIKFVVNMDLMGAGENGIRVVNGTIHRTEFDAMVKINEENDYLKQVKIRGESPNSDHYPFSKKGVKSFFFYLLGDYKHYHVPADSRDNLRLTKYYDKSYLLIRDFILYLN